MKRLILLILILTVSLFLYQSKGQNADIDSLFLSFAGLYNSGDLLNAEHNLFKILEFEFSLSDGQLRAAYNNLGVVNKALGKFDKAIEYNKLAEKYTSGNQVSQDLADIFNNRGILLNIKRSFDSAKEFLEKSIRIYLGLNDKNDKILLSLSSAYINIGISFLETNNFESALKYFEKSAEIKSQNNLTGLALVYLNMAKTYAKAGNSSKADEFYNKSISRFITEFNENYYRLAEVYFDYGLFLRSEGRSSEALTAHQKALSICLKNYGEKHTLVALSYKHLGDHYLGQSLYDSALFYYQKSLIAVVPGFSNPDIYSNPVIDSSLFDIRLLDNLKSKAVALEIYAGEQKDQATELKTLGSGLQTMDLVLQLIDRIRNNYFTEESRIYLAENEKETYIFAAHLANRLFTLTGERSLGEKMYTIAQKAKAAVLHNEITENELLYSAAMPDSLRETKNLLAGNIAAYNNLIIEETRKIRPDSNKISLWKDALFEMNRKRENVNDAIAGAFPQYNELLRKAEPVPLSEIQKHLKETEAVVEYLLSNKTDSGKRKLFTFLITRNNLEFREAGLDSLFLQNAEVIRIGETQYQIIPGTNDSFRHYTNALNYMYKNLVRPIETHFRGKRLIIIPDEEIAWLPFDTFLAAEPQQDQSDFEGLHFLIRNFAISYGYSSSLIFNEGSGKRKGEEVISFLPDYSGRNKQDMLPGAGREIDAIYRRFTGRKFTDSLATETNFRLEMKDPDVFHLAMHSVSDTLNSKYSYLLFDESADSLNDGRLYNYEISLGRISSPMVVLSACNSGTGTLYHGEGLMSLARGFILAGASSVIKTSWEVNDEVSESIITKFYYYLSKGKAKDEAMRLAKLDFISSSPPSLADPYYWAAYEVLGDNAPIVNKVSLVYLLIVFVVLAGGAGLFYLSRRRIFSARSL